MRTKNVVCKHRHIYMVSAPSVGSVYLLLLWPSRNNGKRGIGNCPKSRFRGFEPPPPRGEGLFLVQTLTAKSATNSYEDVACVRTIRRESTREWKLFATPAAAAVNNTAINVNYIGIMSHSGRKYKTRWAVTWTLHGAYINGQGWCF